MTQEHEQIPGMRAQGKGIKLYVEHEFAPLKACIVGNPGSMYSMDPDFPPTANAFHSLSEEGKAFLRKNKGRHMKDSDPAMYEKVVRESDALASAIRQAGVKVIRNESGKVPDAIVNYYGDWLPDKYHSFYGQAAGEVVGNCYIQSCEFWCVMQMELEYREAMLEIFENDKNAVWLTQPVPYPSTEGLRVGPITSAADFRVFPDKTLIYAIGVSDPSHIHDRSKPRSSGDELGADLIRRMLEPFGWKVEVIYFNSNLSYHIDCVIALVDVGIIGLPDNALWTPLPKAFKDWEIIKVEAEEFDMGLCNNVPLRDKKIIIVQGATKFARELEKRGYTPVEVPYINAFRTVGSGIHCSVMSLWREYN